MIEISHERRLTPDERESAEEAIRDLTRSVEAYASGDGYLQACIMTNFITNWIKNHFHTEYHSDTLDALIGDIKRGLKNEHQ